MHRIVLLAATALTALAAPIAWAETGFDFDHTPGRLPKTVVPELYHIDLVTDMQKLTLGGHEVITVTVREPVSSITMNQNGLKLGSAVLETGAAAKISNDDKAQTVTLQFDKPVPAGSHKLTIDYSGAIPNTPAGIYYTDYKTPAGASKRMLVTQFEATDARRMFPGWDEPAFKAKFELSAVLPQDFVPLSNMPVTATTPAGAGLKKVQFQTSPRMSTYLLALVAGDMSALHATAAGVQMNAEAHSGTRQIGGRHPHLLFPPAPCLTDSADRACRPCQFGAVGLGAGAGTGRPGKPGRLSGVAATGGAGGHLADFHRRLGGPRGGDGHGVRTDRRPGRPSHCPVGAVRTVRIADCLAGRTRSRN